MTKYRTDIDILLYADDFEMLANIVEKNYKINFICYIYIVKI